MSNEIDRHARVRLTSRWIEINGKPTIPVAGELHFSRVPPERWEEELRLLVASGITLVSTYVFWIHHEPVQGQISFEGNLDVAEFIATADRIGLDVVLRIGPWCHGEVRNGGFPDWLESAAPQSRTNDPGYLALAEGWYSAIAHQVRRFCGPSGRIVAIQIENELYDQPDHIATLKQLARKVGLSAPLWTATGWGGALLPPREVFPLYSGYSDGFWADQGSIWDDSFRGHFVFTPVWDDPGVGGDRRSDGLEIVVRPVDPEFPLATCELGGGMATAYHRRPLTRSRDIAALANVKIGNGSQWQGFYMFAGGTNPVDHVQESHETGYPNDMPRFDYDFQAAIGSAGFPGSSLPMLREHNAFLAAFGERLAQMYSRLPDGAPVDVHDLVSLRWAVRTDGHEGIVFINSHQPHEPLSPVRAVQLQIGFNNADAFVPDRPVDIPSGLIARWPAHLTVAGVHIEWATASLAGIVNGGIPTLVLHAHEGVAPRISTLNAEMSEPQRRNLVVGESFVLDGALRLLVIDDAIADRLWYVDGDLFDSGDAVWREGTRLVVRADREPAVRRWANGDWTDVTMAAQFAPTVDAVRLEKISHGAEVPARYGQFMGRSSAPSDDQFDEVAAVWRLSWPPSGSLHEGARAELTIEFQGDVAQLRADGKLIADRFWNGLPWKVDVTHLPPSSVLTLHIAPVAAHSAIDFDAGVRAQIDAAGTLCDVERVTLSVSVRWISRAP